MRSHSKEQSTTAVGLAIVPGKGPKLAQWWKIQGKPWRSHGGAFSTPYPPPPGTTPTMPQLCISPSKSVKQIVLVFPHSFPPLWISTARGERQKKSWETGDICNWMATLWDPPSHFMEETWNSLLEALLGYGKQLLLRIFVNWCLNTRHYEYWNNESGWTLEGDVVLLNNVHRTALETRFSFKHSIIILCSHFLVESLANLASTVCTWCREDTASPKYLAHVSSITCKKLWQCPHMYWEGGPALECLVNTDKYFMSAPRFIVQKKHV